MSHIQSTYLNLANLALQTFGQTQLNFSCWFNPKAGRMKKDGHVLSAAISPPFPNCFLIG